MKTTRILTIVMVLVLGMVVDAVKADFIFGEPVNLGPLINTAEYEGWSTISCDGLSLFFSSDNRPGGYGGDIDGTDIWVSTRETLEDDWGPPTNPGPPINSGGDDIDICFSVDGLSLYLSSSGRTGCVGETDLWMATRKTLNDPWGELMNLGTNVNSPVSECQPCLSADGLSLFFQSDRSGGLGGIDIYVTMRATTQDEWGPALNLGPAVNTSFHDYGPYLPADERVLLFCSNRHGGYGKADLYMTRRATTQDTWSPPVNLGWRVNSPSNETTPDLSADGRTLFFSSDRPGGYGDYDLWEVSIDPVVDLNDDGVVDADDMAVMVSHWGTNGTLCDIGPVPWGDGTVDTQDLIVLAEHLFEEIPLPLEVAACWRFDEQDGDVACDSATDKDAVLFGHPVWRPAEGKRDGALEFDGIDDYVSTPFVLNPVVDPFSVFAWIKGGGPGQVIVSQTDGSGGNGDVWLGTTASDGRLMSALIPPACEWLVVMPLESESVVTDGRWHHIGLVWDGNYRALYVDGLEVAKDTVHAVPLKASWSGLYLGVGKTLEPGSFFWGLMDDVRIYSIALCPERIEALAQ